SLDFCYCHSQWPVAAMVQLASCPPFMMTNFSQSISSNCRPVENQQCWPTTVVSISYTCATHVPGSFPCLTLSRVMASIHSGKKCKSSSILGSHRISLLPTPIFWRQKHPAKSH